MRTYHSPYRWWLVGAFVGIPMVSFANNALKHAGDLTGFVIYLFFGIILGLTVYGFGTSLRLVPYISIENGIVTSHRFRKETSFELANLKRVERNDKGMWQAVLREPIVTAEGHETDTVLFPDFNSWRKTNWREALGPDANIEV